MLTSVGRSKLKGAISNVTFSLKAVPDSSSLAGNDLNGLRAISNSKVLEPLRPLSLSVLYGRYLCPYLASPARQFELSEGINQDLMPPSSPLQA